MVEKLIHYRKSAVNDEDESGCTPLHLACMHGHEDVAQLLITSGANVDHSRYAVVCACLLYTSPSPRDATLSRMPSSA